MFLTSDHREFCSELNFGIYAVGMVRMLAEVGTGGLSRSGRHELTELFGGGERIVSVETAANLLGIGRVEAAKRLAGWASAGWLRRVRRGLYLAVPVDAPDPGAWTEDPWFLAALVWSPCFVTGWSAANHWSLTDQVFRSTVIATAMRVRHVDHVLAGSLFVVHHVDESQLDWGLRTEWRHNVKVQIADPARTVAEMLCVPALGGGIRHVGEILETFVDERDPIDLVAALGRLGNGASFKRLGYLIEHLGLGLDAVMAECQRHVTAGIADLDPSMASAGVRSSRWGLRINAALG